MFHGTVAFAHELDGGGGVFYRVVRVTLLPRPSVTRRTRVRALKKSISAACECQEAGRLTSLPLLAWRLSLFVAVEESMAKSCVCDRACGVFTEEFHSRIIPIPLPLPRPSPHQSKFPRESVRWSIVPPARPTQSRFRRRCTTTATKKISSIERSGRYFGGSLVHHPRAPP